MISHVKNTEQPITMIISVKCSTLLRDLGSRYASYFDMYDPPLQTVGTPLWDKVLHSNTKNEGPTIQNLKDPMPKASLASKPKLFAFSVDAN